MEDLERTGRMGEEQELAVGEEIFFSGAPVALPPPGYGRLTELEAKRQRDWVLRWREGEDKRLANLQRERGGNEDLGAIGDGRSVWGPKPPARRCPAWSPPRRGECRPATRHSPSW